MRRLRLGVFQYILSTTYEISFPSTVSNIEELFKHLNECATTSRQVFLRQLIRRSDVNPSYNGENVLWVQTR